jgi:hypothetical protein
MPALAAQAQGQAQGDVAQRQVKVASGHDERVGVYTNIKPDCTGGPLPAIRLLVAPAHGSVTVKRGTLKATNFKQCLAAEVPALLAFYRSAANFNGSDEFELEITLQDASRSSTSASMSPLALRVAAGRGFRARFHSSRTGPPSRSAPLRHLLPSTPWAWLSCQCDMKIGRFIRASRS